MAVTFHRNDTVVIKYTSGQKKSRNSAKKPRCKVIIAEKNQWDEMQNDVKGIECQLSLPNVHDVHT